MSSVLLVTLNIIPIAILLFILIQLFYDHVQSCWTKQREYQSDESITTAISRWHARLRIIMIFLMLSSCVTFLVYLVLGITTLLYPSKVI